ncbi:aminotransferase class I/II-fold pyridoxal phosphate-dependent enzyme [Nocardioides sp. C4-1]|uniref:aminotransferase-like domain-containing protein n=1 Tax=Nocardioides sp. C4-1 TaxID=3151851 RepID=UPI003263D14F
MNLVTLDDKTPRGIAAAVGHAVRTGELAAGDRLPTVREVAADLGVSPATVSAAWSALRRAGLVEARGRAGTFVRPAPAPRLSPRVAGLRGPADHTARLDLSRGTPDPALLPDLGPALRRVSERATTPGYQAEPVVPELRAILTDTWPSAVESITVVDGATDGVARVLEQVVSYGDRVVLENPGFPPFFDLVEALGAEVVPVELDGVGVRPESLRRALATRPAAVLLQPRAHNPTGVSTTPTRAASLARVLRGATTTPWVVEDDASGAISTAPDVTLARWLPDRVVHVRSFSKSHGPDLRIAAVGGPTDLVDGVVARRMLGPAWTSRMIQHILLDLLTTSRSMDEIAEARRQYFARQRVLVERLADHGVEVDAPDGINLWLPVRDEAAAVLHLAAAGIRVAGGRPFLATGSPGSFVRVTSGLVQPDDADDVARALAEAARSA